MWIVLGALVALGGGGYIYLKPVRDAAAIAVKAADTVKDKAGNMVSEGFPFDADLTDERNLAKRR
jgi:hypothetical protein